MRCVTDYIMNPCLFKEGYRTKLENIAIPLLCIFNRIFHVLLSGSEHSLVLSLKAIAVALFLHSLFFQGLLGIKPFETGISESALKALEWRGKH